MEDPQGYERRQCKLEELTRGLRVLVSLSPGGYDAEECEVIGTAPKLSQVGVKPITHKAKWKGNPWFRVERVVGIQLKTAQ